MRKLLSLLVFILVIYGVPVSAQTPISPTTWGGATPNASAGPSAYTPLPASSVPGSAAVNVSQWNRGPGISWNAGANRYNSTSWTVGASSVLTVYGNGDYITFTVTNNASTELNITGVNIGTGQASGTGPNTFGLLYQIGAGPITIFSASATGPSPTFTGTAFTLCAGQTVTFYLCGWGGTGATGTWSINSNAAITASYVTAIAATAGSNSPVTAGTSLIFSSTPAGGVSPYTYSWSGPLSFASTLAAPVISSPTTGASGTYSLSVSDAWGCSVLATTPVTVNPGGPCSGMPAAGIATPGTASFCGSGSTTLVFSGGSSGTGLSYQWSSSLTSTPPGTNIPGATLASYTTPALSAATYFWCTSTCAASGLSNISSTGTVTINPTPTVNVSPAGGNVCSGGSGLSMTVSGAGTYTWAPGAGLSATTGATITANPTINTTYTISGTSGAGCIGTNTVNVTYSLNPSAVAVAPSSTVVCQGTTPQLLTATGGLIGPSVINSGTVTIPASITSLGTISNDLAVSGIPAGAVITDASVNIISFGSQFQDDYIINIKAPNGNILNLVHNRGTHTATTTTLYANTVLSSLGVTPLTSGSGTFTGTWLADAFSGAGGAPYTSNVTSWGSLYGIPNGTWTLSIYNSSGFTNVVVPSAQWSITLNYSYQSPVTWAPSTGLFTDAAGTIPYAGSATNTVYVNPLSAGTTTYTATATNITCTSAATANVTVNPLPATITGNLNVCQGLTTALTETATGGTWTNDFSGHASVDASGVVTGLTVGTANITYTLPTGCITSVMVTVNPLPVAITGADSVCQGLTTALTETATGGIWTNDLSGHISVDASGVVTGNNAGTGMVTYTLPTTCIATVAITVNPLPAPITGISAVCQGLTTALNETTIGGTWMSGSSGIVSVDAFGVVTGGASGTAIITYTLPTGCIAKQAVTVNALPTGITGTMAVCQGLTTTLNDVNTGGTWGSSATGIAGVDAFGVVSGTAPGTATITYTLPTGCIATTVATVNSLPAAITGPGSVCEGLIIFLNETTTGGTWSSSASGTAAVDASGAVTGGTAGNANITYTVSSTGCIATKAITVNPSPAAITGTANVCQSLTTTLSNTIAGGTWTSSAIGTASVDAFGVVTGGTPGTATISYTLPAGCYNTMTITVNPIPAPVSGPTSVCQGLTINLNDVTSGGTWSSSASATAPIDAFGQVTGSVAGTAVITYSLSLGCNATTTITVNPPAAAITGTNAVCVGLTTNLTDGGGGTWSSSNANASVGSSTGTVTGMNAGTATITYTLPTTCKATTTVTVNPLPGPIGGPGGVCVGATVALTNSSSGGTWTSSNPNATIGITSGIATGVTAGLSIITYKLPTGCIMLRAINISPLPSPVTGVSALCVGTTTTMNDLSTGGTWSCGSPHATVDPATGLVIGISSGLATISYTLFAGCSATKDMTINPIPFAIGGTPLACIGATTTLLDLGGGTWTSSNSNATVGLTSGIVTGVAAGTSVITYTLPVTGCTTLRIVNIAPLPSAITGAAPVCAGSTLSLVDTTAGGAWSSANTNISIGGTSGVVTAITAGPAIITYTLPTGCEVFTTVTVNDLPAVFAVTGSGNYCAGAPGLHVGLSGSNPAVSYQLHNSSATVGGLIPGITGGAPIDFGVMTAETYSVNAVNTTTSCTRVMSGFAVITMTPTVTPTVAYTTSTGNDTGCGGAAMLFTASPVNGGSSPVYHWSVNGASLGSLADTFSYIPASGDIVKVKLISNATCALPDSATSAHTLTIYPVVTPAVGIAAAPGNTVCSGTPVTFTAIPVNGGTTPIYNWKVNGINVVGSSSYIYTPVNGDVINCEMFSNATCRTIDSASGSNINMVVVTPVTPAVTINAVPGNTITAGQNVVLTASASGSTGTVSYQWNKNGSPIAGATSATYSASNFSDNDSVSCTVTVVDVCTVSASSFVIIHVTSGVNQVQEGIADISVIPNSNKGIFTIKGSLNTFDDEAMQVEITNVLGQVVYQHISAVKGGKINEQVQLSGTLANGMYLLNVHTANEHKVVHFILEQ